MTTGAAKLQDIIVINGKKFALFFILTQFITSSTSTYAKNRTYGS